MHKIGIIFGTESGTTRLIAKKIAKQLKKRLGDDAVAKPLNVNRATVEELIAFDALILGTPTYGDGELPGKDSGCEEEAWLEFLPKLAGTDLTGKRVALYGCGDQETYPKHFCDAIMALYRFFSGAGCELVGGCSTDGYEFKRSASVVGDRFVGLVLDQHLQHLQTDRRISDWLDEVVPVLLNEPAEEPQGATAAA